MDYNTYIHYYRNEQKNNNQDSLAQSVENAKMYLRDLEMTNEYQSYIIGHSKQPIQYYTYKSPVKYYINYAGIPYYMYQEPMQYCIPPKKSNNNKSNNKREKKKMSLETIPE